MSSAGHVLDMISRSRQNRAMQTAKRAQIAKIRQMYLGHSHSTEFVDRTVSDEDLARIKSEIRRTMARERVRSIAMTILFSMVAVAVLTVVAVWIYGLYR